MNQFIRSPARGEAEGLVSEDEDRAWRGSWLPAPTRCQQSLQRRLAVLVQLQNRPRPSRDWPLLAKLAKPLLEASCMVRPPVGGVCSAGGAVLDREGPLHRGRQRAFVGVHAACRRAVQAEADRLVLQREPEARLAAHAVAGEDGGGGAAREQVDTPVRQVVEPEAALRNLVRRAVADNDQVSRPARERSG